MLLRSSRAAEAVSKEAGAGSSIFKGLKNLGGRLAGDAGSLAKSVAGKGMIGPLPQGVGRGASQWAPKTMAGKAGKTLGRVGAWSAKNPMKAMGIAGGTAMVGGAGLTAAKGVAQSMQTPSAQALQIRRMQGFK